MRFETARMCKLGGREDNQDFADFVVLKKRKLGCWAVADGLGGHRGGGIAAKLAVEEILRSFKQDPRCTPEALYKYLSDANREIVSFQEENLRYSRMRTTVAVLVSDFQSMLWAHLGDTRFYHFREGKVMFQTLDHSVSQARVSEGEITSDQVRYHEDRTRLLKTLGQHGTFRPQVQKETIPIQPNDAFLLCTDGFWEYIEEREMEIDYTHASTPRKWIMSMEKRILKRAGEESDNYTAIGVYFSTGKKK